MIGRAMMAASLVFAVAAGGAWAQSASGNPPRVDMDYGGTGNRAPRQPTVSAKPDEIRISEAIGLPVYGSDKSRLGTVDDVFLTPGQGIGLVSVSGKLVPWTELHFAAAPTPRFTVALGKSDLANAPRSAAGSEAFTKALRGRTVVDRNGDAVGTVSDLVARFGAEPPVALGIAERPDVMVEQTHVVPWQTVHLPGGKSGDLQVALSKSQILGEPTLMTKAPQGLAGSSGGNKPNPADPTPKGGAPAQVGTQGFVPAPNTAR